MSNTDPFQGLAEELMASAMRGEKVDRTVFLSNPDDVASAVNNTLKQEYGSIRKVGMRLPMTWEALVKDTRKGEYVPVGNKHIQKLDWWLGKQLFRLYRATERRLQKFRHYREVSGYDYEEAEYREFEQKKVWREEE